MITEGIKAETGIPDSQGLAFATAAGYVAHTICERFCIDPKQSLLQSLACAISMSFR